MFGYRALPGRPSFAFSDLEYVELEANLGASEDSIVIGDDPYMLIRPEGEWDVPGPLDRSLDRGGDARRARVTRRVRTVRHPTVQGVGSQRYEGGTDARA